MLSPAVRTGMGDSATPLPGAEGPRGHGARSCRRQEETEVLLSQGQTGSSRSGQDLAWRGMHQA